MPLPVGVTWCSSDTAKGFLVVVGSNEIVLFVSVVNSLDHGHGIRVLDLHSPEHGGSSLEYVEGGVKVFAMWRQLES